MLPSGSSCGRKPAWMVISVLIVSPSVTWGRLRGLRRPRPCSARCPLHERADPRLLGGGQLLQREGGRPHGPFVEVRLVAEAERRVPRVELLGALKEADDLAVLVGVRGHPVPGSRRELRRARLDDLVEPLGHGAIRSLHLGDLREHVAFPCRSVLVRTLFSLQLFGALLHRVSFLVRESLGLPRGLLCAHRYLLCGLSHVLLRPARKVYLRVRTRTSRFLIGLVSCFASQDGIPAVARAAWRRWTLGGTPTSSVKRLLKVPSDECRSQPETLIGVGPGLYVLARTPSRRSSENSPSETV